MQVVDQVDEFRGEIAVTILLDLNTRGQPRVEPGGYRIHIWRVIPPPPILSCWYIFQIRGSSNRLEARHSASETRQTWVEPYAK